MRAFSVRCGVLVLLGIPLVAAGCVLTQPFTGTEDHSQHNKDLDVGLIGDFTEIGNVMPLQIHGVGLVTGLEGTGDCPPGDIRKRLENELLRRKIPNIKELLDSANNALVVVSATIPPGAHKGDPIDVEVSLPDGSKTTSLQGGYLQECSLNYETTQTGPHEGHLLGHASGPLLVGFGNPNDAGELRSGRIWSGGITHIDRPFALILKEKKNFATVANVIADRINLQYHDSNQERAHILQQRRLQVLDEVTQKLNKEHGGDPFNHNMAKAVNKDSVLIDVPYEYRFNAARYLRVVRLTPLQKVAAQQAAYAKLLGEMLLEPGEALRAALRLEALGKETTPLFEKGLQSDNVFVRFCAAESLAYLGNAAGCDELARLAAQHPQLTAHCLLALCSMDDAACQSKLAELMAHQSVELRCGAFQALRLMAVNDKRGQSDGEHKPFGLYRGAAQSPSLVYFTVSKRPEVVLFGERVALQAPAKILAGPNFSIIAGPADDGCVVARYQVLSKSVVRDSCSLNVDDILLTMAKLGGTYTDAVEFLKQADAAGCLSCRVNANALPRLTPVETLAERAGEAGFLDGSVN